MSLRYTSIPHALWIEFISLCLSDKDIISLSLSNKEFYHLLKTYASMIITIQMGKYISLKEEQLLTSVNTATTNRVSANTQAQQAVYPFPGFNGARITIGLGQISSRSVYASHPMLQQQNSTLLQESNNRHYVNTSNLLPVYLSDIKWKIRGLIMKGEKDKRPREVPKMAIKAIVNIANSIEYLDLSNSMLKDTSFLSSLSNLKSLYLKNCNEIQHLSSLPKTLEYMDISYCRCLTSIEDLFLPDEFFEDADEYMETEPKLKFLDLSCCQVLSNISNLPKSLEILNLDWCSSISSFNYYSSFSSASINVLPVNIKHLSLTGCVGLSNLDNLPLGLLSLKIGWNSKISIISISYLTHLKMLSITECSELNEVILGNQSSLEVLQIKSCSQVTTISQFPQSLKELELLWCSSIQHLPTLPESLHKIDVKSCDLLNIESLKQ